MKKSVLVTMVNSPYLDAARQVFASAAVAGQWAGDFLLLAHGVSSAEAEWFTSRGIEVWHCTSPLDQTVLSADDKIRFTKFNIFHSRMKQWQQVVYIDADTIVQKPIALLTARPGFWAVQDDIIAGRLFDQVRYREHAARPDFWATMRPFNVYAPAFNTGVFAFSTDLLTDTHWRNLVEIWKKIQEYYFDGWGGEQLLLNLVWYGQWGQLPLAFNVDARDFNSAELARAAIIHFITDTDNRPWHQASPFYSLWKKNLSVAYSRTLSSGGSPVASYELRQAHQISRWLTRRFWGKPHHWIRAIDHTVGTLGFYVAHRWARMYGMYQRVHAALHFSVIRNFLEHKRNVRGWAWAVFLKDLLWWLWVVTRRTFGMILLRTYPRFYRIKKQLSAPPIVIGGGARSGTTLLLAALAAHPAIAAITEETSALAPGQRDDIAFRSPLRDDEIYRWLLHHPPAATAHRWCEKTPDNIFHFAEIIRRFRGRVKCICLVRDGRDAVLSGQDAGLEWFTPGRWVQAAAAALHWSCDSRVLVLRYEDLVGKFDETMRRVCEFIGEPLHPAVLDWYRRTPIRIHSAWPQGVVPLPQRSVGRWRTAPVDPFISVFASDPAARAALTAFGYIV